MYRGAYAGIYLKVLVCACVNVSIINMSKHVHKILLDNIVNQNYCCLSDAGTSILLKLIVTGCFITWLPKSLFIEMKLVVNVSTENLWLT